MVRLLQKYVFFFTLCSFPSIKPKECVPLHEILLVGADLLDGSDGSDWSDWSDWSDESDESDESDKSDLGWQIFHHHLHIA